MHEPSLAQTVILLALAATFWRMTRRLPLQNVFSCAVIIALISGLIQIIGAKTGIPFGPFFYTENLGYPLFHLLPWPVPLLWVVVLLNSHGVARLILKPWRNASNHGLRSLALTCLLAVLFDAVLEPFATRTNRWWIWTSARTIPIWYGAPWINFAGWAATALLILGFITPWLINKKPGDEPPPDYCPLMIWLTLMLLLTIGNTFSQFWAAAFLGFATSAFVAFFAWRNSRTQE
ncbi:MAG: hypothetical protein JWQ04_794 [Pedosphaera sp.]|nr:hypothetical protein [Pedosphaera sp.]